MLKSSKAFSSFSVDDLGRAKQFYGDVLGLKVAEGQMGSLELHCAGGHTVFVYPKDDHQPATFTVLNFEVPSVEEVVGALEKRGVKLERYDGPHVKTDERGISRGDGPKMAWFKDPAGNILSVLES